MSINNNAFAGVDWSALGVPNPNAAPPTPAPEPAPLQPGPTTQQSAGPDTSMMGLAQMLAQNKQPTGYYGQASTPHTQRYLGVAGGENPWKGGGSFEDWMTRRMARRAGRQGGGVQGQMPAPPVMDNPALQEFLRRQAAQANPFGGLNQ